MNLNGVEFDLSAAGRHGPPRPPIVCGWRLGQQNGIERNPVYWMPGMTCFDAGRVASGDFYGDVQLTLIRFGGGGATHRRVATLLSFGAVPI
jgi:hypothetical protein